MNALSTDTTWSLGVLIGGPIAALFILAGIIVLALSIWMWHDTHEGLGVVAAAVAYLVAVFAILGFCYYPLDADYHQWRDVSGTVEQIDNRLIGSGDGMETKFVVLIDGQQYGCDDTRCAGVREGDDLTLSCKRAWQYTGVDGYDCRFISTEASR